MPWLGLILECTNEPRCYVSLVPSRKVEFLDVREQASLGRVAQEEGGPGKGVLHAEGP